MPLDDLTTASGRWGQLLIGFTTWTCLFFRKVFYVIKKKKKVTN